MRRGGAGAASQHQPRNRKTTRTYCRRRRKNVESRSSRRSLRAANRWRRESSRRKGPAASGTFSASETRAGSTPGTAPAVLPATKPTPATAGGFFTAATAASRMAHSKATRWATQEDMARDGGWMSSGSTVPGSPNTASSSAVNTGGGSSWSTAATDGCGNALAPTSAHVATTATATTTSTTAVTKVHNAQQTRANAPTKCSGSLGMMARGLLFFSRSAGTGLGSAPEISRKSRVTSVRDRGRKPAHHTRRAPQKAGRPKQVRERGHKVGMGHPAHRALARARCESLHNHQKRRVLGDGRRHAGENGPHNAEPTFHRRQLELPGVHRQVRHGGLPGRRRPAAAAEAAENGSVQRLRGRRGATAGPNRVKHG